MRLASAMSAAPTPRSPTLRRHHDLVEITRARIDGDEADHVAVGLGDHDLGRGTSSLRQRSRHQSSRAAKSSCG